MNSNSMDGAPSNGQFGQQSESGIARSLKVNPQSKTPYSDSTQVRQMLNWISLKSFGRLDLYQIKEQKSLKNAIGNLWVSLTSVPAIA